MPLTRRPDAAVVGDLGDDLTCVVLDEVLGNVVDGLEAAEPRLRALSSAWDATGKDACPRGGAWERCGSRVAQLAARARGARPPKAQQFDPTSGPR